MTPDRPDETLDPEDWGALRALGHRALDDALGTLETVRDRPVWQATPADVHAFLARPLPQEPSSLEDVYADFKKWILPYPMGNIHPRFWGWVIGSGTPGGVLAEMMAATVNPNVGGADQVPHHLELAVIGWLKQMMKFPDSASGLLVSGGSMANLVGLAVARNAKAEVDLNVVGLAGAPRRMTLYASTETHNSVHKAVGLLGLGREALREIPVKDDFTVDVDALRARVRADRAAGFLPFCVVGNAGTVNTGAIDDLEALADLCAEENLWFHVDGAFGAIPMLSETLGPLVKGAERGDSLAFDLHKWLSVQFEAGCALVKDSTAHHDTFKVPAAYLTHASGGIAAADVWLSEYGVQLSRGFRALKVWMTLKEHGVRKFARIIEQNVAHARYFSGLVDQEAELERMAPTSLNIVCFRYRGTNGKPLDEAALDHLNEQIVVGLQTEGIAMPSSTILNGRYAIRMCNVNHRSRREDFDLLLAEVLKRGRALVASHAQEAR